MGKTHVILLYRHECCKINHSKHHTKLHPGLITEDTHECNSPVFFAAQTVSSCEIYMK